jgi:hypothetical protein
MELLYDYLIALPRRQLSVEVSLKAARPWSSQLPLLGWIMVSRYMALLDLVLLPRNTIKSKKICMFGSSANPPHEGHRHIGKKLNIHIAECIVTATKLFQSNSFIISQVRSWEGGIWWNMDHPCVSTCIFKQTKFIVVWEKNVYVGVNVSKHEV